MACGGMKRKIIRRPSGEDPGSPYHYGRASVVQAEESKRMNAAAGSTPASLTSRKAKRKTAPVERDGQSRKEFISTWTILPH